MVVMTMMIRNANTKSAWGSAVQTCCTCWYKGSGNPINFGTRLLTIELTRGLRFKDLREQYAAKRRGRRKMEKKKKEREKNRR